MGVYFLPFFQKTTLKCPIPLKSIFKDFFNHKSTFLKKRSLARIFCFNILKSVCPNTFKTIGGTLLIFFLLNLFKAKTIIGKAVRCAERIRVNTKMKSDILFITEQNGNHNLLPLTVQIHNVIYIKHNLTVSDFTTN